MITRDSVQQAALREALMFKRSGLQLATGAGKTKIGLDYINCLNKESKVLVVAPKVDIFKSWMDDASKFGFPQLLDRITFSTYLSLAKHDPEDYDILILDEAHSLKATALPFLTRYRGRILGLTGTPPKYLTSEKGQLMLEYYPIKYVFKTDKAVENEILNDYHIFVHYLDLNKDKTIKTKQGWMTSERAQYDWITRELEAASSKTFMFKNIQRINFLKQFETKEHYAKKLLNEINQEEKVLIFANTIDQAERLCKDSHHSKNKNSPLEAFKTGEITKLSCVEQLSEGINIPNLKNIIILHSYSGGSPKASQKIGRALRLAVDQTATVHILCYRNTVDEKWVTDNLKNFNSEKITHLT
jgi:superfamily II DNA or RNA helicase